MRTKLICILAAVAADAFPSLLASTRSRTSVVLQGEGTGGWGIGNSRDMVDEEFARGERRSFEGYELQERGEFMRKVKQDKEDMRKGELDELLAVAKMAGIKVKNPSERLNKFDKDLVKDEDDLDVSVQWEETDPFERKENDQSITRMDEDTGAPGVW